MSVSINSNIGLLNYWNNKRNIGKWVVCINVGESFLIRGCRGSLHVFLNDFPLGEWV